MAQTAQKEDNHHSGKKHVEIKNSWMEARRNKPPKLLGDLGKEAGLPTTCGMGLKPLYSSISGNSDPSNQRT